MAEICMGKIIRPKATYVRRNLRYKISINGKSAKHNLHEISAGQRVYFSLLTKKNELLEILNQALLKMSNEIKLSKLNKNRRKLPARCIATLQKLKKKIEIDIKRILDAKDQIIFECSELRKTLKTYKWKYLKSHNKLVRRKFMNIRRNKCHVCNIVTPLMYAEMVGKKLTAQTSNIIEAEEEMNRKFGDTVLLSKKEKRNLKREETLLRKAENRTLLKREEDSLATEIAGPSQEPPLENDNKQIFKKGEVKDRKGRRMHKRVDSFLKTNFKNSYAKHAREKYKQSTLKKMKEEHLEVYEDYPFTDEESDTDEEAIQISNPFCILN